MTIKKFFKLPSYRVPAFLSGEATSLFHPVGNARYELGQALGVREPFRFLFQRGEPSIEFWPKRVGVFLKSEGEPRNTYLLNDLEYDEKDFKFNTWYSANRMPMELCRLVLEVVSVRLCKFKELTEQDAAEEGLIHHDKAVMHTFHEFTYRDALLHYWDREYAEALPYHWVNAREAVADCEGVLLKVRTMATHFTVQKA